MRIRKAGGGTGETGPMWRRRIGAVARWGLLTLTVMLVVAWPVSEWREVGHWWPGHYEVFVSKGGVAVIVERGSGGSGPPVLGTTPLVLSHARWLTNYVGDRGGHWWWFAHDESAVDESVQVPLWSIIAVAGAAAAFAWRKQLRPVVRRDTPQARRRRGACVSCGYDRRGLTATTACPECGSVPTA